MEMEGRARGRSEDNSFSPVYIEIVTGLAAVVGRDWVARKRGWVASARARSRGGGTLQRANETGGDPNCAISRVLFVTHSSYGAKPKRLEITTRTTLNKGAYGNGGLSHGDPPPITQAKGHCGQTRATVLKLCEASDRSLT